MDDVHQTLDDASKERHVVQRRLDRLGDRLDEKTLSSWFCLALPRSLPPAQTMRIFMHSALVVGAIIGGPVWEGEMDAVYSRSYCDPQDQQAFLFEHLTSSWAALKGMLGGNVDKVKEGIDKAGDMVDEKTGGKFSDKIEMAEEKIGEVIEGAADEAEEA